METYGSPPFDSDNNPRRQYLAPARLMLGAGEVMLGVYFLWEMHIMEIQVENI